MISVQTFQNIQALEAEVELLLRETLSCPGNLMLSGGSTPYTIYNRIAQNPCPVHPDRRLFLSDERMVPPDSPKNNAANLLPMLRALKCEDRFIRVDTTCSPEEATEKFAQKIHPLKEIDLALLGMGADGHTAGIFTLEHAQRKTGPLTLHGPRPDGMHGVSISPALLSRAKHIILLVPGEAKRTAIGTLLHQPQTIPAGVALSDLNQVTLWTDLQF